MAASNSTNGSWRSGGIKMAIVCPLLSIDMALRGTDGGKRSSGSRSPTGPSALDKIRSSLPRPQREERQPASS